MSKQINFRASDDDLKLLNFLLRKIQEQNPGMKVEKADILRMGMKELERKFKNK